MTAATMKITVMVIRRAITTMAIAQAGKASPPVLSFTMPIWGAKLLLMVLIVTVGLVASH